MSEYSGLLGQNGRHTCTCHTYARTVVSGTDGAAREPHFSPSPLEAGGGRLRARTLLFRHVLVNWVQPVVRQLDKHCMAVGSARAPVCWRCDAPRLVVGGLRGLSPKAEGLQPFRGTRGGASLSAQVG